VEPSSSSSAVVNGCPSEVSPPQQMVQQGVAMTGCPHVHMESKAVSDTKVLAAELCHYLYTLGWVSGAGGSITLRVHDDSVPRPAQLIVMAPSGVRSLSRSLSLSIYIYNACINMCTSAPCACILACCRFRSGFSVGMHVFMVVLVNGTWCSCYRCCNGKKTFGKTL